MKIDNDILKIIESGYTDDNLYYLPSITLDRKTYLQVNKVLENLGGKWNRKLKAHVFIDDIEDMITNVLLSGEIIDKQKEFNFFETPVELVEKLVDMASVSSGHLCLEPSAGKGRIANALVETVGNSNLVHCVELLEENRDYLHKNYHTVVGEDFLQYNQTGYDRIVMNPPFSKQQDINHVSHAIDLLKSGGVLVSVMSASVTFRENKKTNSFWDKVKENSSYYYVNELPDGTFKESGTMVRTVVLYLKKD